MHDDLDPVWFDFSDLGAPGWWPVSKMEMEILYLGAQDMMAGKEPTVIDLMIAQTKTRLRHQARRRGINPEWVSTATMITAMAGIQGHELPAVRFTDGK